MPTTPDVLKRGSFKNKATSPSLISDLLGCIQSSFSRGRPIGMNGPQSCSLISVCLLWVKRTWMPLICCYGILWELSWLNSGYTIVKWRNKVHSWNIKIARATLSHLPYFLLTYLTRGQPDICSALRKVLHVSSSCIKFRKTWVCWLHDVTVLKCFPSIFCLFN